MNKLLQFFSISLILIMVGACSEVGIFYTLENEKVIENKNNLNDKVQFENLIDTNPLAPTGYYIGNGGPTVYYRSKVGSYSNWSKLEVPTTGYASDATTSSMVLIGNNLYISRISHDGSNTISGIHRLLNVQGEIDGDGVTSSDWVPITVVNTGTDASFAYYKLFTAGGGLYVNELEKFKDADSNGNTTTNSIVYYSGVTPESTAFGAYIDISLNLNFGQDTTTTEEVIGMDFDTINSNYWLIYNNPHNSVNKGYAYFDDDPTFSTVDPDSKNTSSMVSDIYFYSDVDLVLDDYILIAGVDKNIYTYNASTPGWGSAITAGIDSIFRGFANIEDLTGTNRVIVGTTAYGSNEGEGYFQINMDTLTIDKDDQFASNYRSSDLSDASITGFLMDEQNDRLFAYTVNEGVWLNISTEWTHE